MRPRDSTTWSLCLFMLAFAPTASVAANAAVNWKPTKPIRLVVPYAPGGAYDVVSRVVGDRLSAVLGQPIVVDNRAGASGMIGFNVVAKAEPDGYTFVTGGDSMTVLPYTQSQPFDPRTLFVPISMMATQPVVLAVHASVPATTAKDLFALAKAKPGKLSYATSGPAGVQHLTGELIRHVAGIDMTHVPYKGGGPAIIGLVGGEVQAAVLGSSTVTPHARSGKVRILAVTSKQRARSLPEVPAMAEIGLSGVDVYQWIGVFGPAKLPKNIIDALNVEIRRAAEAPATQDKLQAAGLEATTSTPEQLQTLVREGVNQWGRVIKDAKLKVH